ncbi:MAG: serine hydrolase domain-containing protein [Pseudomonadota bacterium]
MVGAAVALVNEDGVFWAKGFGVADKEAGISVTPDTLFRAGSISKSVVSLIAMRLVEEGRLDLYARLRDVAPEVEFTNKWEDEAPVRLVHLLEHTTGWDGIHPAEGRSDAEQRTIIDGLAINPGARTSRWPPGRYPAYSNLGSVVMGHVLEKTTGEDFETLAQRYVFRPIGAETATFSQSPDTFKRLAKGYKTNGEQVNHTRTWARPSGALQASVNDIGRLVQLHIRRGEIDGNVLLSSETMDRIERPESSAAARNGLDFGYGLGNFALLDWANGGGVYHGHDGMMDGFLAISAYRKDAGVGFVVLLNSQNFAGYAEIQRLVQSYLAVSAPKPTFPKPGSDPHMKAYEGLYQGFTPRDEGARMMTDMTALISVRTSGDHLFMRNVLTGQEGKFIPVGGGRFANVSASQADRIFYENESGEYQFTIGSNLTNSTYGKVSPMKAYGTISLVIFVFICSVIAVIFTLVWTVGRLFGKFSHANRWRVWAFPMLSITIYAGGIALSLILLMATSNRFEILGAPNIVTRIIQGCTILPSVFAVLGLIAAFTVRNVSTWARWHAGVTSLAWVALSLHHVYYNQIGLTFWAYTPPTYERYVGF